VKPGFESWTQLHKWVEFVVGSGLASEGFSPGSLVSHPPQKPTPVVDPDFELRGGGGRFFFISPPPFLGRKKRKCVEEKKWGGE